LLIVLFGILNILRVLTNGTIHAKLFPGYIFASMRVLNSTPSKTLYLADLLEVRLWLENKVQVI